MDLYLLHSHGLLDLTPYHSPPYLLGFVVLLRTPHAHSCLRAFALAVLSAQHISSDTLRAPLLKCHLGKQP